MILFQAVGAGSQTSRPMPAEVDGAPAGPALPGPTSSFTRHTSAPVTGGAGEARVPDKANESPALKAFTRVKVVFSSGLQAGFILSFHLRAPLGLCFPPG